MKQFVLLSLSVMFLLLALPVFSAQAPCTPLYGGGENKDGNPFCLEQVSAKAAAPTKSPGFTTPNDNLTKGGQPTNPSANSGQAKGGLTVYPSPNVANNPNTGPELFGLAALIPAAAAGWALRKKTP